jgi:hypothetical protein
MKVKETQELIDEIMKINESKFVTPNQYKSVISNFENKIKKISKERESLLKNQSIPFSERIQTLQAFDKDLLSYKESVKFLEEHKVRPYTVS